MGSLIAGEISTADQQIIDAGVKKAKKLAVNPLPFCGKGNEGWFIPGGFKVHFGEGGVGIKDGDMVINATQGTLTVIGVNLERGEYAVIKSGKAEKGNSNLIFK